MDTNVLIDVISRQAPQGFSEPDLFEIAVGQKQFFVSIVSIWEIDIKTRLKKLHLGMSTGQISALVLTLGGIVLEISEEHVLAQLSVEPNTKDPFDRLLLTTAAAENARLVTRDAVLQTHPLAWRSFPQ